MVCYPSQILIPTSTASASVALRTTPVFSAITTRISAVALCLSSFSVWPSGTGTS
ncbi:uncharacterized protein LW94_13540 [Fusarium fujikuroi]|nr:uncharacterized protein LW94_13540 [Fusarium fujikuroi]